MDFATIEADLDYFIETVHPLGLRIQDAPSRPLPPFAPQPTAVSERDVVFKLNLENANAAAAPDRWPEQITLFLFQPKPSVTDLTAIYAPPAYQGHGPQGNYYLLVPTTDPPPRKEDAPLYSDYVAPHWDLVPGGPFHITEDNGVGLTAEEQNTTWPGPRPLHMWSQGAATLFARERSFRVARSSVARVGELFLLLLEIRTRTRCRLMARTIWVKPPAAKKSDCVVATAAFGTPLAAQVDVLRRWRDDVLLRNAIGRSVVGVYDRLSPPTASVIARSGGLRALTRAVLTPFVLWARRKMR